MGEGMSEQEKIESGRARVRRVLVGPLEAGGMVRKRGVKLEDHDKRIDALCGRLEYMSERGLEGLRMHLIRVAGARNQWPDQNCILSAAWAIEVPPPRDNAFAVSLMHSQMGRDAREGGWHVELYDLARRIGPPPNRYSIKKLKEKSEENRDRVLRVSERIERGRATPDDRRFLDWYQALRRDAERFVAEGMKKRGAA